MWTMIASLQPCVDCLAPAFTQPSFAASCQLLLGWAMCLGKHTLLKVGHCADPRVEPDPSRRHGLDGYYNFFERAAWTPADLAYRTAILLLTRLPLGGRIALLVDDTLAHKRGKAVWGLGWFRDAVASTPTRVATAPGHNWVVLAVAFRVPFTTAPILALPLLARLRLPGKGQPSCPQLAKQMLIEVLSWFPDRDFVLTGDGAYACKELLEGLPQQVTFVGRMRGDAALYDPHLPKAKKGRRGRKPTKGQRLPGPTEAAARADRTRKAAGASAWRAVAALLYGQTRSLCVVSYQALWPRVLGLRPIQVVVVRDPEARMRDCYLFTTDVRAEADWVIGQFAWRWSIEVLFRSSKQVLQIEGPQHWCQQSVEKVAPWVWCVQSVVMVWYLTAGYDTAEAKEMRQRMGPWDSEWSLRHMMQVLRRATLNATIDPNSANEAQLREMVSCLKTWANLSG
jgi:hypothetical protein